jgi:hypothetical protein
MRIAVLFLSIALAGPCSAVDSRFGSKPNLEVWYTSYNAVYFGDRLPKDTILQYGEPDGDCGETFRRPDGGFRIVVSPTCNVTEPEVVMTLIHEMVHVDQYNTNHDLDCHGPTFQNEMKELAQMGIFKGLW